MAKFYLNNHNIKSIVTFLYDFHLSKIEEMRVFLHIFELQCCIFGQKRRRARVRIQRQPSYGKG